MSGDIRAAREFHAELEKRGIGEDARVMAGYDQNGRWGVMVRWRDANLTTGIASKDGRPSEASLSRFIVDGAAKLAFFYSEKTKAAA